PAVVSIQPARWQQRGPGGVGLFGDGDGLGDALIGEQAGALQQAVAEVEQKAEGQRGEQQGQARFHRRGLCLTTASRTSARMRLPVPSSRRSGKGNFTGNSSRPMPAAKSSAVMMTRVAR